MKTVYKCGYDFCGLLFDTKEECEQHERDHEWYNSLRQCFNCPHVSSKLRELGRDDWYTCYECGHPKGGGDVIPIGGGPFDYVFAPEDCPDGQPGDVLLPVEGELHDKAVWFWSQIRLGKKP